MMGAHGGTLHDAWAVWERVQRDVVERTRKPANWATPDRGPGYAKAPAKKARKPAAGKPAKGPGLDSLFDSAD